MAVAVPLFPPLQLTSVEVAAAVMVQGVQELATVATSVAVQPLLSVIVTVYVLAIKAAIVAVLPPFDQLKA